MIASEGSQWRGGGLPTAPVKTAKMGVPSSPGDGKRELNVICSVDDGKRCARRFGIYGDAVLHHVTMHDAVTVKKRGELVLEAAKRARE